MPIRNRVNTFLRKFEKDFDTLNQIDVSRSALLHNLDFFRGMAGKQVIAVLKGNAYGHGIEQITMALDGRTLPYIAVDNYYEALRVRNVSKQPVLVMGIIRPDNFARLKYDNFAFVVQDVATVRALGATKRPIKVHLECNTGMNRYGVKPDEVAALVKIIQNYKNLELEGVMSHLATSSSDDQTSVDAAVAKFDRCVEIVRTAGSHPTLLHVAQTAGSLRAKSAYANTIRIGRGLYGANPFSEKHALYEALRSHIVPVLTLTSTITKIIDLEKGDYVGYGRTFVAPKRMKIGVLPLGYYEAIDERLVNAGAINVNGTFVPVTGEVSMNTTMISLEGAAAQVGDKVIIYSNNPADRNTVDAIAKNHGLSNHSLLTRLSSDIRRTVIE